MTKRILLILSLIAGGAFGSALMAQTTLSGSYTELADQTRRAAWYHSANPALLIATREENRSRVELALKGRTGELVNYSESERERDLVLDAASLYRLSDGVVVYGEVSYENRTLDKASGSYWIDPSYAPFDLIELTAENAGEKCYESYRIAGRVGAALTPKLAGGLTFDYTTANYAKHKDLRHVNALMALEVTAGLRHTLSPKVAVGAAYTYLRRNETLQLDLYGKTDRQYYSLVSYGGFFGKSELFGDSGYTKAGENKPLFEQHHAISLQLEWQLSPRLAWFNEWRYAQRDGSYGDPSASTVVYAEYNGTQMGYRTLLTYTQTNQEHLFDLDLSHRTVENFENLYNYEREETGRDWIEYLGQRDVGERHELHLAAGYTARWGIEDGLAKWQSALTATYRHRDLTASNYPDYRKQSIAWWRVELEGKRNFRVGRNCYTLTLRSGCGGGSGAPSNDGRYTTTDSETQSRTLNDLLMQEYEFLTTNRLVTGIDFRYMRTLGRSQLRAFVEAGYQLNKAFRCDYLDNAIRHEAAIRIGCHF